jgi:integration host factor subunit beta
MTKADLIKIIAEKSDMTLNDAEAIVNEIFSSMIEVLQKGEGIEIRWFGSFRHRLRDARTGRNPKTGQSVKIPAKRVVYFKVGKELRNELLKQIDESKPAISKKAVKAKATAPAKTAAKRVK